MANIIIIYDTKYNPSLNKVGIQRNKLSARYRKNNEIKIAVTL